MAVNFKKWHLNMETYKDKNCSKHKHNYSIKYLLIVTNTNKFAGICYNTKEYYQVLKCDSCNSFIPDSIAGNYNHWLTHIDDVDKNLPVITANTIQKCPHYNFSKLVDVVVKK